MHYRLIRKALATVLIAGTALSYAPSTLAINIDFPNNANINLVQVQSLPGYETVCSSASGVPCYVAAGDYQIVVFSNGWMDIENSIVSVTDSNQPDNNPDSISALSNVIAFMYSDDFIEIQFDRLPENVYPELRRDGVALATNGVRSSSLIFRGAEVQTGNYELVAVSNIDLTESASLALSVDSENRHVRVGTSNQPTNTPATLSNIKAFVYGSDFVEIQFDRLPNDASPELRLNGQTVATNGVGSGSLIFRGANVVSGNYDLVAVSSNAISEIEPITINIDLDNRVANINGPDVGTAKSIADIAFEYIYDLAAYKSDQLVSVVPELTKIVIDTAIGNPERLDNGEFLVDDVRSGTVTTATNKVRYQCSGGGSMVYETGAVEITEIRYSNQAEVNHYVFDQCLFKVSNNSEANGNYRANGTLLTSDSVVSGSRFSQADADYEWIVFDLLAADSLRYEVDGSVRRTSASGVGNAFEDRMVDLNYYQKSQNNVVLQGISDNKFQMDVGYHPSNLLNLLELSFAGRVQDSRGADREFDIATLGTMTFTAGLATESLVQNGQTIIQVSDGAFMNLDASGADDRLLPAKSPLVNFSATLSDGTTETDNNTTLGSFITFFNYCDDLATDVMADCSNEDVVFFLLP